MSVPTEHRTVLTLVLVVFATYFGDFKYQVAVTVLNCAENASIHRQAINIIVSERAFPNCSERHRRDFNQFEGKISWVSGHSRPHVRFPGDPRDQKCEKTLFLTCEVFFLAIEQQGTII